MDFQPNVAPVLSAVSPLDFLNLSRGGNYYSDLVKFEYKIIIYTPSDSPTLTSNISDDLCMVISLIISLF